jgi:acyl phosphate:glycerol-3-phosphate acyltransferase
VLALLLSAFAGWLIGSFPAAYLLVKHRHGLDLRREGSTNVGANNAFRTSRSKRTGAFVLVGDALKGVLAVNLGWLVAVYAGVAPFGPASAALLGAVAGHNYNVFLSLSSGRLAGGKGLATGGGGFLLLLPWMVLVWVAGFAVGLFGFARWQGVRSSIPGNVVGTVLVPFAGWWWYGPGAALVLAVFALLVLPKHAAQVRELMRMASGGSARPLPDVEHHA